VQFFQNAAKLDPTFFEAQMNYGEVNLSFRGFGPAEGAFRKALAMRPNDYDAHLGLALALRGQINDSNYDQQVAAVQSELEACKKIDPQRPDAYYNEGILTQEFKTKTGSGADKEKTKAALRQAIAILQDFVTKAGASPDSAAYAGAVKKAKDRIQDANDIITFLDTPDAAPEPKQPAPAGGDKKDDDKKDDKAAPGPAAQGTQGAAAPAQPVAPKK
jgi:tetratricopeptide (TPR) repeat protein